MSDVVIFRRDTRLYWRPNAAGYTRNIWEAGRYPRDEAERITADLDHIELSDAPAIVAGIVQEMARDAGDLLALLDKQLNDEWRRGHYDLPDDCELTVTFTAQEVLKLERILQSYERAANVASSVAQGPAKKGGD